MTVVKPAYPSTLCSSWGEALEGEFSQDYMQNLATFLQEERKGTKPIYPPKQEVFQAFNYAPLPSVRLVLIGQDPYHGPGQAHGLCFSVKRGVRPPPSLRNIFLELKEDLGVSIPSHGDLSAWAKQGILLLNATLTVRQGEPRSHYQKGWERFTDRVVEILAEREKPVVFILWGRSAYEKVERVLAKASHCPVLTAPHPSPFSAHSGFFGSRHFSKANEILSSWGEEPISWELS